MARLLALILVLSFSACASAPRPPSAVGAAAEEPIDPSIKPLSRELEDAGQ